MTLISLTTDFGLQDSYVGQIKAVILALAPHATIVDLVHQVPPQNVLAGSLALESAASAFPRGSVHLAVVDPGVGSTRRGLAVATHDAFWVGPDNGLFTLPLAERRVEHAVALTNPSLPRQPVSATFHGRDIFAPAAGQLAIGTPITALGEPVDELVQLEIPAPSASRAGLEIHVLHIDHFGNLITDLRLAYFEQWRNDLAATDVSVLLAATPVGPIRRTFSDVAPREPVAYFGSSDRLEIAIRNGSAAGVLNASVGTKLYLRQQTPEGHSERSEGSPNARDSSLRSE